MWQVGYCENMRLKWGVIVGTCAAAAAQGCGRGDDLFYMPIFGNIPGFVGRLGNFFHLAKVAMALRPACAGRAVGSGGPRQTGCGSGRQRQWKIWKWERENGKEATPHLLPLARCTGGSTITLIPFPAALLIAPGVLGCGVGVMAADQQLLYFVFYYHIAWRAPTCRR